MTGLSALPSFPGPEQLTPELAQWLLGMNPRTPEETAEDLAFLCRSPGRCSRDLGLAFMNHLERSQLLGSTAFGAALASRREALLRTAQGTLLLAQWAERRGELKDAAALLGTLAGDGAAAQNGLLLDFTRILARDGATEEACTTLRRAAASSRDFGFLSRAAKLLARLKDAPARACARSLRIALIYPYTTDLWAPLLRLGLFREGLWADLLVPPYGTHEQALLDPSSSLFAFDPEVVILAHTWRDLNLPAFVPDPAQAVSAQVERVVERWKRLQDRFATRIIQHDFEVPALDPNGHLGHVVPGGRASIIRRINDRLLEEASRHHVTLLGVDHLAACYGKRAWSDPGTWFMAKQYPAPSALPALVDGQVTRIRAGLGLTKKVLVLDLDNTLWGGVVGEDGVKGIQIGPPSATGEAHLALQRYAAQLKERGILLAVCSKNNEADARAPFLEHEGMHLKLDDFVVFTANWKDKPSNVRSLASTLNLGLDSFVFLDDNPTERALMRQELPQVAVPELGSDPAAYAGILDATGYFDADFLSPEDLERSNSYRNNLQRDTLRTQATSLEAFLGGLNMVCEHGPFNEHVLARVVQLLGKTNQFNLTTRRHGEAWIRQTLAEPGAWTQYFRLQDKFDDNGLVGVMIARPSGPEGQAWEVDTWLMSCRVIGRQLENFMFNTLLAAARERGVASLKGLYFPTAKNGMVAGHYLDLGFVEEAAPASDHRVFSQDCGQAAPRPAAFIRDSPVPC